MAMMAAASLLEEMTATSSAGDNWKDEESIPKKT